MNASDAPGYYGPGDPGRLRLEGWDRWRWRLTRTGAVAFAPLSWVGGHAHCRYCQFDSSATEARSWSLGPFTLWRWRVRPYRTDETDEAGA